MAGDDDSRDQSDPNLGRNETRVDQLKVILVRVKSISDVILLNKEDDAIQYAPELIRDMGIVRTAQAATYSEKIETAFCPLPGTSPNRLVGIRRVGSPTSPNSMYSESTGRF